MCDCWDAPDHEDESKDLCECGHERWLHDNRRSPSCAYCGCKQFTKRKPVNDNEKKAYGEDVQAESKRQELHREVNSQVSALRGKSLPPALASHQPDYQPDAWKEYSLDELGDWVARLSQRATHRSDRAKAQKDLQDAFGYLTMMKLNLEEQARLMGFTLASG